MEEGKMEAAKYDDVTKKPFSHPPPPNPHPQVFCHYLIDVGRERKKKHGTVSV